MTDTTQNSSEILPELQGLSEAEGIAVWGTNQENLEAQALQELQIFSENKKPKKDPVLNINIYLQKQEELNKKYICKKSLEVENAIPKVQAKAKCVAKKRKVSEDDSSFTCTSSSSKIASSGSEYYPSEGELCDSDLEKVARKPYYKKRQRTSPVKERVKDDGAEDCYKTRLELYYKKLEEDTELLRHLNDEDLHEDFVVEKGFKVPGKTWYKLYCFQQEGVKWLWKLHKKPTGGLLGDEMGLGKTVQIIAFLQALQYNRVVSGSFTGLGPTLIVCPATVLHQWVKHFHEWAPEFRVAILHQSGSFTGPKSKLIKKMAKEKGIIITTYLSILKFKGILLEQSWHYIILDEGHKIRNPSAQVSKAIKEFKTPHHLVLTGSPMQNNLQELWSLFDFTNPGMLGQLNTFQEHFIGPIVQGGFSNASPMQEASALSVATTLKTIISPYLLRRTKVEVQDNILLPNKSEQVLFCSMTEEQKKLYTSFLLGEEVNSLLGRGGKSWMSSNKMRANMLIAITMLRKICNHPQLFLNEELEENNINFYKRSGKMLVVSALLKIWKKQQQKALLFTQGRAMLAIFEDFLTENSYKYLKMDGTTSIGLRQEMINKFNEDPTYDLFLLTTRVGGLGVNLTGASRVIIYDPDWNPATDSQARERAWRIGQDKQVTIYRLLSAGTIEEKMYQRQVWKQLLSNKVLIDPTTHRFFKSSDIFDLFSFQDPKDSNPETTNIFHESRIKLEENLRKKNKLKSEEDKVEFSQDKIQSMKELAQKIAKSISNNNQKEACYKSDLQLELEEEKLKKKLQKEKFKKLTPVELMHFNRKKNSCSGGGLEANQLDDSSTKSSFEEALSKSETICKKYHDLTPKVLNKIKRQRQENLKKSKETIVDTSGKIDGELVENLVRTETKKSKKKFKKTQPQNDYILQKLFSKKGVSGALEHDAIVEPRKIQPQSLKVNTEADLKANKSLEAIRKSRLDDWTW